MGSEDQGIRGGSLAGVGLGCPGQPDRVQGAVRHWDRETPSGVRGPDGSLIRPVGDPNVERGPCGVAGRDGDSVAEGVGGVDIHVEAVVAWKTIRDGWD